MILCDTVISLRLDRYIYILSSTDIYIYIYISVELNLSVSKLLPQLKCDRREKRHTFEEPHGGCHGGVDGRQFSLPEKSASRIFSVRKGCHVFVSVYGMHMRYSGDLMYFAKVQPFKFCLLPV